MAQPAQGNMLSTKQEKPLYTQEPFSKQLMKAVQGKLVLEDIRSPPRTCLTCGSESRVETRRGQTRDAR
jgi:hypothetical protein